jgi:tRNA threonylcarbamoyladenosine biosynthesis protein TsaB
MPKTRVHGMNVLAFDTCLGAVSAAVRWKGASGEWQVASRFEARAGGHAERLMPMIAEVMEEAGLAFADLGRIAVTVGPGTLTGVRGGVAAARGLALASGLPVVTATSLAVMAQGAREQLQGRDAHPLAVAVDARRGMVYLEIFDAAPPRPTQVPSLLAYAEAGALVGDRRAVVVGSGAAAVADAIAEAGGQSEACLTELQPDARSLMALAEDLTPVHPVRPLYLRAPDAKPQEGHSLMRVSPP